MKQTSPPFHARTQRLAACVALTLALACSLAACGGGSGSDATPTAPTTPQTPQTPADPPAPGTPTPDTGAKPEMRCAP